MKNLKEKFNSMSKNQKIVGGLLAVFIVGNILNLSEADESKAIEPVQAEEAIVEEVVAEPEVVEEAKVEYQYDTRKNYHENDASNYEGRAVHEIELFGEFDLESETIKDDAMELLQKEAEIGLQEQPDSVMVRVFIYQGTKEDHEQFPVSAGTFDVKDGELSLRYLPNKTRYPIFYLKN